MKQNKPQYGKRQSNNSSKDKPIERKSPSKKPNNKVTSDRKFSASKKSSDKVTGAKPFEKKFTPQKPKEKEFEKKFAPQKPKEKDYEKKTDSEKPLKKLEKKSDRREKELFIWGRRTVEGYLANLHTKENYESSKYALHIIVDKEKKAPSQLKSIVESAKALGISFVAHTSSEDTWPLAGNTDLNHQRVCLKVPEYPVAHMEDVLASLKALNKSEARGCVGLVLDQIQDPRNFGAILRSAAFFGVSFVIFATDRQSDIGGIVLKTSAGGAFALQLAPVVNINRALAQLKEAGAWTVGATLQEKSIEFKKLPKDRNWVLVLGNEEKGLRQEVAKNCDYLLKIPGCLGGVDSLNVSVAAGICIHELQSL